jgi:PIN domain nuclease of toxin-antitoxin system
LTGGERNVLDTAPVCYVSAVSLWEIALLLGRGRIPRGDERLLDIPAGFDLVPIRPDHCKALVKLPRHHGDPFDRMLVAQARCEGVPLLTRDRSIATYGEHATILRFPAA